MNRARLTLTGFLVIAWLVVAWQVSWVMLIGVLLSLPLLIARRMDADAQVLMDERRRTQEEATAGQGKS